MLKKLFYRGILRLPDFRGKSRIENMARRICFAPEMSKVVYGLIMELDPLEWTQISLIKDGFIEPLTTALYGKLLRPGDTYVDVGAHIGFHTLIARYFVGDAGRVFAIEPQPYNCQKLMANWRANNFENLMLYVAAAGDQNTTVVLHNQSATDKARLSLCLEPVNDQPQQFRVPLVRLDTIFNEQDITHVRLLKIDVEGYEPEVITGLGQYSEIVENIVVEVLGAPSELTARSLAFVETLMYLGYRLQTVEGKSWTPHEPLPENNIWASRKCGECL